MIQLPVPFSTDVKADNKNTFAQRISKGRLPEEELEFGRFQLGGLCVPRGRGGPGDPPPKPSAVRLSGGLAVLGDWLRGANDAPSAIRVVPILVNRPVTTSADAPVGHKSSPERHLIVPNGT